MSLKHRKTFKFFGVFLLESPNSYTFHIRNIHFVCKARGSINKGKEGEEVKKERNERVISIDVLRGLSLMGILFINLPIMESVIDTVAQTKFEVGLQFVYDVLIQTKFYTIFSFLFGVSAYYFYEKSGKKEISF